MSALHVGQVATVFVPVADQDRALDFYVGTLGFEKRSDFVYGGVHRWVEVAPAGSAMALALVPPSEGDTSGAPGTVCALVTTDIEADHAALLASGVAVDERIGRAGTSRPGLRSPDVSVQDPQPAQVLFRDPDGNQFLIVQPA